MGLMIFENGVRKDISHGRIEQEAHWWPFLTRLRPNLAQYYATGSKTLVLAVRMSQPNDDCWRQTIEKNCLQWGQILRPRLENSVGNASLGEGLRRGNMA